MSVARARSALSIADRADLAHLISEWDLGRNGDLLPHQVTPGVARQAWWLCAVCGHSWEARVGARAKGGGCRPCFEERQRAPKPGESLAEVRPDLVAEWDVEVNGTLTPRDVKATSGQKVAWVCDSGHRWVRDVYARAIKRIGCNTCADIDRRKPKPGTSLAERRPDLAVEWDREANGDLSPYDVMPGTSRRTVHWVCVDGHRWTASPNRRTNAGPHGEHGCPTCAIDRSKRPEPGQSFGDLCPGLLAQWDHEANGDLDPYGIKPFCDSPAHWVCALGHRWTSKVTNRALGNGCPRCKPTGWSFWEVRIRTELEACGLPIVFPHPPILVEGRRPVAADIVMPDLGIVIECDGQGGHRWPESLDADRQQTDALQAAGWTVIRVRQGLDALGPLDVVVTNKNAVSTIVKRLLVRLEELGVGVPAAEYAKTGPWAVDQAEQTIAEYLRHGLPTAASPHARTPVERPTA